MINLLVSLICFGTAFVRGLLGGEVKAVEGQTVALIAAVAYLILEIDDINKKLKF